MRLDFTRLCAQLVALAARFNAAKGVESSFALATAIRDVLDESVQMMDQRVLPMFRKALLEAADREEPK